MPWCEQCAKFWNPSSMTAEGACPSCGRTLERPAAAEGAPAGEPKGATPTLTGSDLRQLAGEDAKAPWHFKLMVGALAVYLTWRIVDLVMAAFR